MRDIPDTGLDTGADPDRLAWLHLGHAPDVPQGLRGRLRSREPDIARLGTLLAALVDGDDALVGPDGPVSPAEAYRLRRPAARDAVARSLDWESRAPDRHLITLGDARYPDAVSELDDAPPVLALRGDPAALAAPGLAVVGSREATVRGREHAREFAGALAALGVSIVSGLARGIDAAAHEAALAAGGLTLAVVATGPDRTYPARHAGLAARIAERGAVVTENPCGFALRPYHFPHRNRLISALSLGTLVVEAADPSGSLSTVTHAQLQGRAVMAIPGNPAHAACAGCHRVIREGGTLVTTPAEVAAALHAHMHAALDDDARAHAVARAREGARAEAVRRRAGEPARARADVVDALGRRLAAPARDAPDACGHWSGDRTRETLPGLEPGGPAHRVHVAMDEDGLGVDALVRRTGLPVPAVSVALARLEMHALARRDGAGGYVPCKPHRLP